MGLVKAFGPWILCLLLVTPVLGTTTVAAAEGSTKKARALFKEAVEALRSGDNEKGRDLLRESLAERPSLPARYNLAMALRRTGDTREAISTMRELLDGDHGELSPDQRKDVEKQLEEASNEVGYVRVKLGDGAPDEATLIIDGQDRGPITSRRKTFDVDAGRHTITATAEGYAFSEEEIKVEGQDSLRLTIGVSGPDGDPEEGNDVDESNKGDDGERKSIQQVEQGRLIVSAKSGQVVEIEGVEKGIGSMDVSLPEGEYDVRVDDETKSVVVEAGETTRITFGKKSKAGLIIGVTLAVLAIAAIVVVVVLTTGSSGPEVDPITGLGVTLTDW